jgi:hypothetical protein
MNAQEYITLQAPERQELLTELHAAILANDPTVAAAVGTMMGKEMILYNAPGTFKYGLASGKNYMSLHCLPMYMHPSLHARYKDMLPGAGFQKGCINFTGQEQMPPEIVSQLISDCSGIDLLAIREAYLKSSKPGTSGRVK